MVDNKLKETSEAHSCQFAYGKLRDVVLGQYGNFYCRRCNGALLITQVSDRVLNKYKEVENGSNTRIVR